jgi:hypothetical protein
MRSSAVQNFPHDQENPQPVIPTLKAYLYFAFVNVFGCYEILEQVARPRAPAPLAMTTVMRC